MESVRHLFVWIAVGTGHVALLVSVFGHGSASAFLGSDTALDIVWVEPEVVLAPVVLAPLPQPRIAASAPEVLAIVPRSVDQPSPVIGLAVSPTMHSPGDVGATKGEPPSFADRIEPSYPRAARLAGIEGVVRLRLEVTALGTLRRAEVLASSGDAALDRAALQAAEASTYRPARVSGAAVEAVVEASYRFELR